eukprot:14881219-Alexandrium_andersonii.AAC.1
MGVDRKQTLDGKTREQTSRLLELAAAGAEVFLLTGRDYAGEYAAVGRSWNGPAMSHAKMAVADRSAAVGSCSWTTASRANNEVGVLLDLNDEGRGRLETMVDEYLAYGTPLREALRGHAQRA